MAHNNKQASLDAKSKFQSLEAQIQELTSQNQKLNLLATESINRLFFVENKLSPALLRKPSLLSILFHWREVITLIGEIISIIKEFREKIQSKPANDTDK